MRLLHAAVLGQLEVDGHALAVVDEVVERFADDLGDELGLVALGGHGVSPFLIGKSNYSLKRKKFLRVCSPRSRRPF